MRRRRLILKQVYRSARYSYCWDFFRALAIKYAHLCMLLFLVSCAATSNPVAPPDASKPPCHYIDTGFQLVTCEAGCHESLMKDAGFMYVSCIDNCQCVTGDE